MACFDLAGKTAVVTGASSGVGLAAEDGPVRVVVQAAGVMSEKPLPELGAGDLDRMLRVNLNGVAFGYKHAPAAMTAGGSIVTIASMEGVIGLPGYGADEGRRPGAGHRRRGDRSADRFDPGRRVRHSAGDGLLVGSFLDGDDLQLARIDRETVVAAVEGRSLWSTWGSSG